MCEPTTIAVASLGLTAASGGMQAYGAAKSAASEKANLQAQAETASTNAALARTNGEAALKMADINAGVTLKIASNQADMITNLAGLNSQIAEASAGAAEGQAALIEGTAKINADSLELQAEDTYSAGQRKAQGVQLQAGQLKGSQRAALAANGVTLDSDSSLRILTETDVMADRQVDAIHLQAIKDAMGYRTEAVSQTLTGAMQAFNARAQATMTRSAGRAGLVAGDIQSENVRLGAQTDVLNSRQQAESDAMNARLQALSLTNQSRAASANASAINPGLVGATSLINSAGQVASKWYGYQAAGMFSSKSSLASEMKGLY